MGCAVPEWQLSSLEQVSTSSLPPVPTLEDLYIFEKQGYDEYEGPCWQNDIENSLWPDLLRSFVALKNLYLSKEFAPRIVPTLQELYEGIEKFVAARQLTSHPVAVSRWDGDLKQQGNFWWEIYHQ